MAKIQRLTADQRLNLVAYLDGELDEAATQEIEQVLAQSPVARHDVEIFTRTWEMLDLLPRVTASEDFTERTLNSLQVDQGYQQLGERAWFRQTRRTIFWVITFAGLLAGGAAGFMATYAWVPQDADELIENLSVIENLETYREVGNVEFLQLIQSVGELSDEPPKAATPEGGVELKKSE